MYHITTNPGTSMITRRIQTFFLELTQSKGVYIFIAAAAIWLLQLFSPIHATLGKIRCEVVSFWLGLTAVCLVCGSGLVWSGLLHCVSKFTARTESSFKQMSDYKQSASSSLGDDTRFIAIMILLTEIFKATAAERTPSILSFSCHVLYKKYVQKCN